MIGACLLASLVCLTVLAWRDRRIPVPLEPTPANPEPEVAVS
jgi:hypothetical protein